MVDTPLERLLEIGMADLRRNQAEFARVAKELEPDKTARQVLAELAADHPEPGKLLDSFRATFDGLIGFITDHQIVTIPSTRAADPAGDAAVHARDHLRLDGHAGTVRAGGAGGLFQRHAAGSGWDAQQAPPASWRSSAIR